MKKKRKLGRKLLSFLLTLAMVVGLMPGMSLTAYAVEYSDFAFCDELQPGDILKPGVELFVYDDESIILQANGWGEEGGVSNESKEFSPDYALEIRDDGLIEVMGDDYTYTYCYPYVNDVKVSAWKVVSVADGEDWDDPKTITLTGYAPPERTPVTEIDSDTTLTQNIEGYVTITSNVTLDLAGYTITGGGHYSTIVINHGYTLTLIDSSEGKTGTITGGGGDMGGGVAVSNSAVFNMQGGTITGNSAAQGGGVYSSGTFNMSGGKITGNSTTGGFTGVGGGVVIESGDFIMSGTASITNNNSGNSGNGGGVYFDGNTFTMKDDSSITRNTGYYGAGVYMSTGTLNMSGNASVSSNTARGASGGVNVNNGCTLNMSGNAAIANNRASYEGGAIYLEGTLTMTDSASITGNSTSDKSAGGICVHNGNVKIGGGVKISGNTRKGSAEDINLYPGKVITVTAALTEESPITVRRSDSNGSNYWEGVITADDGSSYTVQESDANKFSAASSNQKVKWVDSQAKLLNLYRVTYNANGATSGEVPSDSDSPYLYGETVTVLDNTGQLARTDHSFEGWNTKADGSGTPYAAGATFDITGNTTLYAQWKHIHRWSYTAGTGENANTITAKCNGEGGCDYKADGVTLTLNAPNASDLVYDGNIKEGNISVYPSEAPDDLEAAPAAIMYYATESEGSTTPAGEALSGAPTNAGNYMAEVTWGGQSAIVTFSISKLAAPTLADDQKPTAKTPLTYNGYEQELVTAPTNVPTDYTVQYSLDGTNWSTNLPEGTNAGDYNVKVKYVGDVNHTTFDGEDITVTIGKVAAPTLTDDQKPAAKTSLTYTGTELELVTAPTNVPTGYTVQYALGTETQATQSYTTAIPTAANAGIYYVWYKVVGDANHNDADPEKVSVSIGKADATITAKDQTIKEGEFISEGTGNVEVSGLQTGHSLDAISLACGTGETAGKVIASDARIKDGNNQDVTSNYTVIYVPGILTVRAALSRTVTFKVVNGSWNDETTTDKTVTLTGYEGDTLKLAANQIPEVGTKPNDTYKAGSWDVMPSTDAEITGATIYTYTYAQKSAITPTVSIDGWTYGETANEPSVDGNTGNGAVTYTYAKKDTTDFSATVPSAAGEYTVKAVIAETDDYLGGEATVDFTIAKANAAMTAPTAKTLTYTGSEQELVNAGSTNDGTLYYAVTTENKAPTDESLYTTDIPTATNTGTYYVWYKIEGDINHKSTEPKCIKVNISENDKSELEDAIEDADDFFAKISDIVDYQDVAEALKDNIAAAEDILNTADVTQDEIDAATEGLKEALQVAKDAVKAIDDEKAAEAVRAKIKALKDADKITLDDKEAVEDARAAYDALTDDQKKLISDDLLNKLIEDEEALKALEDADSEEEGQDDDQDNNDNQTPADVDKDEVNPGSDEGENTTPDTNKEQADPTDNTDVDPTKNDDSSKKDTYNYSNEWVDGLWYSSDGSQTYKPVGHWEQDIYGWYYIDEAGWYPTNMWQKIDGYWYFFNEEGYMCTNQYCGSWDPYLRGAWWVGADGRWDGSACATWNMTDGTYWFGDTDGWFAHNGWLKICGYWYYFDSEGWMLSDCYIGPYYVGEDGAWQP